MSEYGPDFFRYYIDRLDERQMTSEVVAPGTSPADAERRAKKNIEKFNNTKFNNTELGQYFGPGVGKTLCPPGAKSAKCGGGNIDYENYRPPEDVDARPQIDFKNFRPPEDSPFFDPCPGKSQTLDPKTGKCVSVIPSIKDYIDQMQNDPMARPLTKGRK